MTPDPLSLMQKALYEALLAEAREMSDECHDAAFSERMRSITRFGERLTSAILAYDEARTQYISRLEDLARDFANTGLGPRFISKRP